MTVETGGVGEKHIPQFSYDILYARRDLAGGNLT